MMEVLEELGDKNPIHRLDYSEVRAWQSFLQMINEHMILGYQEGRATQTN
jgi:hypothetical protein